MKEREKKTTMENPGIRTNWSIKMQTGNQRYVLSHYGWEDLQMRMADSRKPY